MFNINVIIIIKTEKLYYFIQSYHFTPKIIF